jgi:D-xylose transport system substrate-binding protein
MTSRLLCFTFISLIVIAAACGRGAPPSAPDSASPPPAIRIGFILATEQEERYQRDKAAFLAAAEAAGATVIFLSSNNDEATQRTNVESVLARGIAALVVQPVNSDNAGSFVDLAHARGVPLIAYDRMINHRDLDYYAGQNSAEVGRLQAEAAIAWMNERGGVGPVLILSGQQGHSVAEAITEANRVALAAGGVPIAAQQYHDAWGTDQALATTENLLVRNSEIKAILCNNSGMARGAIQAVEKAGRSGRIFITGADADKANVEQIIAGRQQQDVYKDEITLARTAAELAIALARGTPPEPKDPPTTYKDAVGIRTILTPVRPVTAENFRAVVVEAGPRYAIP